MTQTRRDFVKRSAAAGGVLWATPAISSVSSAWAQAGSEACQNETCPGRGYGLSLSLPPLLPGLVLADTTSGPVSLINLPPLPIAISLSVIGADVGGTPCYANAHVDNLTLGPIIAGLNLTNSTLTSSATMNSDCTATLHSNIVNVRVNGQLLANGEATPNFTINVNLLAGQLRVIVNEQGKRCNNGVETHFVNALHVTLTPLILPPIDLVIAHSEIATTCCSC